MNNRSTLSHRKQRFLSLSLSPRSPERGGSGIWSPMVVNRAGEIRQLREDVLNISNFERERVGHELHDDFTQNLAGIGCLAKQLKRRLERLDDPELAGMADDIAQELHDALDRIRIVSHELAPRHLEDADLVPSLHQLIAKTAERTGVTFDAVLDDSIQIEDVNTRLHLYRLSQEAIRNAIQHGKATEIRVELQVESDSRIRLSITDNGVGFSGSAPSSDGLGLRLMKYRCQQIGSTLSLEEAPAGGATVTCAFSVSEPVPA